MTYKFGLSNAYQKQCFGQLTVCLKIPLFRCFKVINNDKIIKDDQVQLDMQWSCDMHFFGAFSTDKTESWILADL